MTSLTDRVAVIEESLTAFDTAIQQLEGVQAALEQAQSDIGAVRNNETLSVAERAKKMVLLKSTIEVLESDCSRQQSAIALLRTQIIADSTDLRGRFRAEVGGKISDRIREVSAQLQSDFDVKKIMFPIDQVACAHHSVLQLRTIETSLHMLPPNDDRHIDFARTAKAFLTQIG